MKLLLVEDEISLSRILAKGLRKLGYAVDVAEDGEAALACWQQNVYDLIVLDLNLPKINGFEVLRRIRTQDAAVRVLILSARSEIDDRVTGLDTGANDYLTKPFDFRELEARIRGLLRRRFTQENVCLRLGCLQIDTALKQALWKKQPLALTKKEYGILEYLMLTGKTVSAEELIEHVWDSQADLFSNTLKFHISQLRKKLEETTADEIAIVTLRGQGYRLTLKEKS